jgi:hypothetical protein
LLVVGTVAVGKRVGGAGVGLMPAYYSTETIEGFFFARAQYSPTPAMSSAYYAAEASETTGKAIIS